MAEQEIRIPSSITGWAVTVAYTALMGLFTWVLAIDREVSRIAATQSQMLETDRVLRDVLVKEISDRRDDMQEMRRQSESIRDVLQRHSEQTATTNARK